MNRRDEVKLKRHSIEFLYDTVYPAEDMVFGLLARVPEIRENCQSLSSSLFGITSLSEPLQPCQVIRADIQIVFKNSVILISRIPVFDIKSCQNQSTCHIINNLTSFQVQV